MTVDEHMQDAPAAAATQIDPHPSTGRAVRIPRPRLAGRVSARLLRSDRTRRRTRLGVLLAIVLAALAGIALLPWEWSFIDDSALLTNLHYNQARHGQVGGVFAAIAALYRSDLPWGLFRPAYCVYGAAFYLLPVGLAHAVRVGMLGCALAGPLVLIGRTGTGRARLALVLWAGALLAANAQLFSGIWYPSLQELSGLCFVGAGLLASRRPAVRTAWWLVAAWFKTPFAWLLIAYGVLLCRRRETRVLGAGAVTVGLGTVLVAGYLAHTGWYTKGLDFGVDTIQDNLTSAGASLAAPMVIALAGILALRPRLSLTEDPTALVLLAGGAGYLGNLLAWHTGGYYASPYVYLLSVGVLLAVREVNPPSRAGLAAGLVLPVLVAGYVVADSAHAGYQRMATVTGLRDCVLGLPNGAVVGFNRHEAWTRLDFLVRIRRPGWTGRIVMVEAGQTLGHVDAEQVPLDYFIYSPQHEAAAPALLAGPVVCRTPDATVHQVT